MGAAPERILGQFEQDLSLFLPKFLLYLINYMHRQSTKVYDVTFCLISLTGEMKQNVTIVQRRCETLKNHQICQYVIKLANN